MEAGHMFVTVTHPKMEKRGQPGHDESGPYWQDEAWKGVFSIVLATGDFVWVQADYSAEGHPEVMRVGDGREKGYDHHGGCVLSVPAAWCEYWTEEEANSIMMAQDADERLLDYM
jgi:hypothetical protein